MKAYVGKIICQEFGSTEASVAVNSVFGDVAPLFDVVVSSNACSASAMGTSKTIQDDLIDSVSYILKEHIELGIGTMGVFFWRIDETTDISCLSQLSIIIRNVKNGEAVERFLGFYDVSSGRTAEDLFNFLMTHCEKFDFKTKLVAQTYDGSAVMAS
nr:unnamed protein product [Callosobruchus analis]